MMKILDRRGNIRETVMWSYKNMTEDILSLRALLGMQNDITILCSHERSATKERANSAFIVNNETLDQLIDVLQRWRDRIRYVNKYTVKCSECNSRNILLKIIIGDRTVEIRVDNAGYIHEIIGMYNRARLMEMVYVSQLEEMVSILDDSDTVVSSICRDCKRKDTLWLYDGNKLITKDGRDILKSMYKNGTKEPL